MICAKKDSFIFGNGGSAAMNGERKMWNVTPP